MREEVPQLQFIFDSTPCGMTCSIEVTSSRSEYRMRLPPELTSTGGGVRRPDQVLHVLSFRIRMACAMQASPIGPRYSGVSQADEIERVGISCIADPPHLVPIVTVGIPEDGPKIIIMTYDQPGWTFRR